jgi:hypothetical protein
LDKLQNEAGSNTLFSLLVDGQQQHSYVGSQRKVHSAKSALDYSEKCTGSQ